MDQQINKRYRWSPGTIEALQRIAAIDGDLSENLWGPASPITLQLVGYFKAFLIRGGDALGMAHKCLRADRGGTLNPLQFDT